MSDYGQLAQTGVGALVIGGTTFYVGSWMLGAAAAALLLGVGLIRFRFRADRAVGEK